MTIDLHIHSTFSDGSKSPSEIVRLSVESGLSTIALTDHDTMDGTAEIMEAAEKAGIKAIPGLELSVVHRGKPLHILGYYLDAENEKLQSGLARIQRARIKRNNLILEKLDGLGITITTEELELISAQGQTGRPHIAALLVNKGVVKTIDQAFKLYLKKDACGYVSRREFPADEAVQLVRQAGGIAVLAHPIQFSPSLKELPQLFDSLIPEGLDGVELYYPTQSVSFRKKLIKIASQYDLIFTGGSDYHGENQYRSTVGIGMSKEQGKEIIHSLNRKRNRKEENLNP